MSKTNWELRDEHRAQVRAERKRLLAVATRELGHRPGCLYCGRRLSPVWKHDSVPYDRPQSSETRVLRGWGTVGNVFCTGTCAIRYALDTTVARLRRAENEATYEKLNNIMDELLEDAR